MFYKVYNFDDCLIDIDDINGVTNSEKALYYGGWNLDKQHTASKRDVKVFKAMVPDDGAYMITITIENVQSAINDMCIFVGRRNPVEVGINVAVGSSYKTHFLTYVSPYYPAMSAKICRERAVYISITGENANISKVIIEQDAVPTLFVAGDSTLTDQNAPIPYYPFNSCCGWAQAMGLHLDNIAICNQAHSGMTTNCFRDDGHWDIIKGLMKPGDVFMMQFGHNDQKRRNLAAFGGYTNNLRWYVNEVRKLGGFPIIISPISRVPFLDNGRFRSLLATHALACRQAAFDLDVPFIDLHDITFKFLCENYESASDYFIHGDITHTNEYGAVKFSQFVADEIKNQKIEPLCRMLSAKDLSLFDKFDKEVPVPELNNSSNKLNIPIPYVDIEGIPQYEAMKTALENWLLDPCVMHLHPNDFMPRAQFLMVYFKAIKLAGKRPYLGKFCDLSRYEWDSGYVQACIDENLLDITTVIDDRFRPDDPLTVGEYASFVIRGLRSCANDRNIEMADCLSESITRGIISSSLKAGDIITRADCYAGLVKLMEIMDSKDKALPNDVEVHPVG